MSIVCNIKRGKNLIPKNNISKYVTLIECANGGSCNGVVVQSWIVF